jgi:hypothetical protein
MTSLPRLLPVLAIALSSSLPSLSPAHEAAAQMAEMARTFLGSLSAEQKDQATFTFAEEERINWHFIPRERLGLSMKDMNPQQRLLAHGLLNTGLSFRGAAKAVTIMSLEEVLFQMEGADSRAKRDPEQYFVSIFGEPADEGTWGWRIEGHHLSMNFTIKDGKLLRATPSFFGSNPGVIEEGPLTGLRVLGTEEELGRKLVKSLDASQMKKATVAGKAPKEMETVADPEVSPLDPKGISSKDLSEDQQGILYKLVDEYLARVRPDIAKEAWKEIKEKPEMHFGWAGGKELGDPHYYRVQGASFLLEYANTQNGANHVHSVWRSFDGDFGRDILGEHLKKDH